MPGDSTRVMLLVTQAFERMGIPYAVGGSIASSLHGMMRSTVDIDILAEMGIDQVEPFVRALSKEFYMDREKIHDAMNDHASFNLIHYATSYKVDVFIAKQRNFDRKQLERRKRISVSNDPQESVYLASAEDVILAKLEWFRKGGEVSERHWRDVLGVLKVQAGALDLDYLHQMAAELKVTNLLERALK